MASCSFSCQYDWAAHLSSSANPRNKSLQSFSCLSVTEVPGMSVEEGAAVEANELPEQIILRIPRPHRVTGDASLNEETGSLPKPSWMEPASTGDKQQVANLILLEKAVAIRGLIHELEAHSLDHLSNLCDEGHFNAAVQALNVGDEGTIRKLNEAISQLLQIYITNNDLKQARQIHFLAKNCGLDSDPFLGTRLVLMYNFFERLPEAKNAFRRISKHTVYSWNALMSAYARTGQCHQVLSIYHNMRSSSVQLNSHLLVTVLKACRNDEDLMCVHSHVVTYGLESKLFVGSALIDMYVKCGRLEEALTVFQGLTSKNVVTWSTLIAGYAEQEHPKAALHLFVQMQQGDLQPNGFTFVAVLKACASLGDIEICRLIHSQVVENELETDAVVCTAIVDTYAKTGNLDDACRIFDRMGEQDVVTWSALVSGHALSGQCQEALKLFWQMLHKGVTPDNVAFCTILQLCPSVAAYEQGIMIHMLVIECGFASNLFVGSALLAMYAHCGNLEDACTIFEQLHKRSVLTWFTIIYGCAQHNEFTQAVKYFEDMQEGGMQPNSMTFLALLFACNNAGLVEKGIYYMKLLREAHGDGMVMPKHFSILVDLFGRKGLSHIAEDLLETLHFRDDGEGWLSLLSACYIQGAVGLGRRCFDCLLNLGATDSAYIMMSSIYALAGMHGDAEMIEEMRRAAGLPREAPIAYIEIEKRVHAFTNGDTTHLLMYEILSKLKDMEADVRESPKSSGNSGPSICCDKVKGSSEEVLCGHCEKLAVAFGLISSPPGTIIRVSKNLRMCAECHNFLKVVSKAEARDIVVFVADRIHRFQEGVCCCNDIMYT